MAAQIHPPMRMPRRKTRTQNHQGTWRSLPSLVSVGGVVEEEEVEGGGVVVVDVVVVVGTVVVSGRLSMSRRRSRVPSAVNMRSRTSLRAASLWMDGQSAYSVVRTSVSLLVVI